LTPYKHSDPKFVKLELDTAHLVAGGGDPARRLKSITIVYSSFKDVGDIPADTPKARYPFEFVELGRGRVDLPSVFAALDKVKFRRWAWSNLIAFLINRELQRSRRPLAKPILNRRSVSPFNFLEVDGGQGCPSASLVLEQSPEP
jgi:inosose dehydratase